MKRLEHPTKFEANKLSLNLVLTNSPLVANIPALAVTGDIDQLIHIELDQQSLDMQDNVVTFTDNVIVAQGIIKINADRVIVICPDGEQGKEVIDDYGRPTTFYQVQDSGKPAEGHASRMHYELAKDLVVLTDSAYLQQVDSNTKGDKITYLVKEQGTQTLSGKGKRVIAVLMPSQPQGKNNRGQIPAQKEGN